MELMHARINMVLLVNDKVPERLKQERDCLVMMLCICLNCRPRQNLRFHLINNEAENLLEALELNANLRGIRQWSRATPALRIPEYGAIECKPRDINLWRFRVHVCASRQQPFVIARVLQDPPFNPWCTTNWAVHNHSFPVCRHHCHRPCPESPGILIWEVLVLQKATALNSLIVWHFWDQFSEFLWDESVELDFWVRLHGLKNKSDKKWIQRWKRRGKTFRPFFITPMPSLEIKSIIFLELEVMEVCHHAFAWNEFLKGQIPMRPSLHPFSQRSWTTAAIDVADTRRMCNEAACARHGLGKKN